MAYNPSQTTTWSRSTPNDGLLLEAEYNRIYGNTTYLYSNLISTLVKTSGYTILSTDEYQNYIADTTTVDVDFVLPALASNYNKRFKIINVNGANIASVTRGGADTITDDGLTSIQLPKKGNFVELLASEQAGCWIVLSENITSQLVLNTYAGFGSTDTKIMRFTNLVEKTGNMFIENHSTGYSGNTEGLKITANKSGYYSFNWSCAQSAGNNSAHGFSLNSTQLDTSIFTITLSTRRTLVFQNTGSIQTDLSIWLDSGDFICFHTNAEVPATAAYCHVTVKYNGS